MQALPSSQGPTKALWLQPSPITHESTVQLLLSSHAGGAPPMQTPAWQTSFSVHGSPSSHALSLRAVWTQPVRGKQPSAVQAFLSSQVVAAPPRQTPSPQASPTVQALPSSQAAAELAWTHPRPLVQLSIVQGFPSSHASGAPPWHAPLLHASPSVQGSPSLQLSLLLTCVQPLAGVQPSVVQGFLSSQLGPPTPEHTPSLQTSPLLQELPSLQAMPSWLTLTQPSLMSQESAVQALPSSHVALAPAHRPMRQLSPLVHALPSSQGPDA